MGFLQVFILKPVKVVCFDTDSQVFILRELAKNGFEVRTGPEKTCETWRDMTASSFDIHVTLLAISCQG